MALYWRNNGHHSVSNHQPHDCLLNGLFRRRSMKISKLHVTGLCAGNSPETGEFPAQMASNAENVSIWWRHHGIPQGCHTGGIGTTLLMPYLQVQVKLSQCISMLSARLQYLQCVSNGHYKNPLHLDVVDRYLRRMEDKPISDEAPPSLESFYPPWVAGIDLPQSRCCGFFVSFTNKHKWIDILMLKHGIIGVS